MKKISAFICALLIVLLSFSVCNQYLEHLVEKNYTDNIARIYGDTTKDKGLVLQEAALSKKYNLMMYGSSELGTLDVPQNPANFFPTDRVPLVPNIIGRGYVQDLQHAINFGAISDQLNGKPVVFILSMQWFTSPEGINSEKFRMNFSPAQFYAFMQNDKISYAQKEYVAKRFLELINNDHALKAEAIYCQLLLNNSFLAKTAGWLMKPYYYMRYKTFAFKDNIQSLKLLQANKSGKAFGIKSEALRNVDWAKEKTDAVDLGKRLANNNKFLIENGLYDTYYRDHLSEEEGRQKGVIPNSSKEYQDLNLLLSICQDNQIKPLFVIMPVNGKWYDFAGISRETRQGYYQEVEKVVKSYSFPTANFADREYEDYLMKDSMHLGWKGWVYVNEAIDKYYYQGAK